MRGLLLSLAFAVMVAFAAPAHAAHAQKTVPSLQTSAPVYALQIPDKKIEITIGDKDAHWYRSPVWIAIGVLALIVLVLLIVIATRGGGGTTIVRD